jgi:hypothetical protein
VRRLLILMLAGVASMVVAVPPGQAATGTPLPFTGHIFDVVADGAHELVFVSGGEGESGLEVFDFAGAHVASLGIGGASGMVVVGDLLYVAAADDHEIAVVDLGVSPPVVDDPIGLGTLEGPTTLGYGGGRLWFSAFESGTQDVYAVDTDGGNREQVPIALNGGYIRTSPVDPDLLLFAGGPYVETYDVGGPSPVVLRSETYPGEAGNISDADFESDGASFLIASGAPYTFPEFRTSDLAELLVYDAEPYPTAVEISARHGGLVAGGVNGIYDDDVYVYHSGDIDSFWRHDFGEDQGTVSPRGLAWAGDALFVVTDDGSTTTPRLQILYPLADESSLDLAVSKSLVKAGDRVTVTAALDSGSPNRTVRIYATKFGGSRQLVKEAEVGGQGNLSVRYDVRVRTTFEAEYDGDADWSAATGGPVTVRAKVTTTGSLTGYSSTSGKYRLYHPDDRARYTAKVVPGHAGEEIRFTLEGHNGRRWVELSTLTLDLRADSTRTVSITGLVSGINFRVRAAFASDGDHVGDAAPWSYLRVLASRPPASRTGPPTLRGT